MVKNKNNIFNFGLCFCSYWITGRVVSGLLTIIRRNGTNNVQAT